MADLFDKKPPRMVGNWMLRSDLPVMPDKRGRKRRQPLHIEWPFLEMQIGESFDVLPEQVGLEPSCSRCDRDDLLKCANIVSSAASSVKYTRDICGNITRNFETHQIGGRLVRCHRTL
jgi:hypothetical protein